MVANEWTVMIFFAGDNPLAPMMISELKAIKDAGFQRNTTVVVHFDPNEIGVPTRLYNINQTRKKRYRGSIIGDGSDSYVRNLREDEVKPKAIKVSKQWTASKGMREALENPVETDVKKSLERFLGYCREKHQAKHYILYLVGHGMIVGNDAFLPDDHVIEKKDAPSSGETIIVKDDSTDGHPITALSLKQFREILRGFAADVKSEDSKFELLAMHSCSMSAVEVAYELKDTASYMIATQGAAFINVWPYRQLLKNIFSTVNKAKGKVNVRGLVRKLYFLSLCNATDFMSAGYSSDLCLCSLEKKKVEKIKVPISRLVAALKKGLGDNSGRGKELILLAHWESQSFWEENYTDLYDFCRCLSRSCDPTDTIQKSMKSECDAVMKSLDDLVLRSDNFGIKYQYSHGLSIYFPWTRPVVDEEDGGVLKRYKDYEFATDLGVNSWFSFLDSYFDTTKRKTRDDEDGIVRSNRAGYAKAKDSFKPSLTLSKPNGEVGPDCACPSIKNHAKEKDPKEVQGRKKLNVGDFSISDGALRAFKK